MSIKKAPTWDVDEAIELYQSGKVSTFKELSERYGVCISTIHKTFMQRGVETNGYNCRHGIDMETCVKMYESGVPLKEIALHFKCSRTAVNRRLYEAGVKKYPLRRKKW